MLAHTHHRLESGWTNGLTFSQLSKLDPSRTLSIQKSFIEDVERRFKWLEVVIWKAIVDLDVLDVGTAAERTQVVGLRGLHIMALQNPEDVLAQLKPKQYSFPRSSAKIDGFMGWLNEMEQKSVLEISYRPGAVRGMEQAWSDVYVHHAYQQGVSRGREELRAAGYNVPSFSLDPQQDVSIAFNQPIHADRLGLAYTRSFTDLKGITKAMDTQISRVLAEGLASGHNPVTIAKNINDRVDKIGITRAKMLARTEVMRAHHMANMGEYRNAQAMGIRLVAEWETGATPCDLCSSLAQKRVWEIDEIESTIPVHPNCMCVAVPLPYDFASKEVKEAIDGVSGYLPDCGQIMHDIIPPQFLQANTLMEILEQRACITKTDVKKVQAAIKSYVPCDKKIQDMARLNEIWLATQLRKLGVKGVSWLKDNEAYDIWVVSKNVPSHMIEAKSFFRTTVAKGKKSPQIGTRKECIDRKWQEFNKYEKLGTQNHTILIDDRYLFDKSLPQYRVIYYREGVGHFYMHEMQPVTIKELAELMKKGVKPNTIKGAKGYLPSCVIEGMTFMAAKNCITPGQIEKVGMAIKGSKPIPGDYQKVNFFNASLLKKRLEFFGKKDISWGKWGTKEKVPSDLWYGTTGKPNILFDVKTVMKGQSMTSFDLDAKAILSKQQYFIKDGVKETRYIIFDENTGKLFISKDLSSQIATAKGKISIALQDLKVVNKVDDLSLDKGVFSYGKGTIVAPPKGTIVAPPKKVEVPVTIPKFVPPTGAPGTGLVHWEEAMNVKELSAKLAELGINNLKKNLIDEKTVLKAGNLLGEELTRLLNTFPGLRKTMGNKHLYTLELTNQQAAKKNKNVAALYFWYKRKIKIGTVDQRLFKASVDKLKIGSSHSFLVSGDLKGIFRHELGHYFDGVNYQDISGSSTWKALFNKYNFKKEVSEYSEISAKEAWAETFAAYTSPLYKKSAVKLPQEVEDFIAGILNKTKMPSYVKYEGTDYSAVKTKVSGAIEKAITGKKPIPGDYQKANFANANALKLHMESFGKANVSWGKWGTKEKVPCDLWWGKGASPDYLFDVKTVLKGQNLEFLEIDAKAVTSKLEYYNKVGVKSTHFVIFDENTGKRYITEDISDFIKMGSTKIKISLQSMKEIDNINEISFSGDIFTVKVVAKAPELGKTLPGTVNEYVTEAFKTTGMKYEYGYSVGSDEWRVVKALEYFTKKGQAVGPNELKDLKGFYDLSGWGKLTEQDIFSKVLDTMIDMKLADQIKLADEAIPDKWLLKFVSTKEAVPGVSDVKAEIKGFLEASETFATKANEYGLKVGSKDWKIMKGVEYFSTKGNKTGWNMYIDEDLWDVLKINPNLGSSKLDMLDFMNDMYKIGYLEKKGASYIVKTEFLSTGKPIPSVKKVYDLPATPVTPKEVILTPPYKPMTDPIAADAAWAKHPEFVDYTMREARGIGGAHSKFFVEDKEGKLWLFKPYTGEAWRAEADEMAYKIGRLLDPDTVEVRPITVKKEVGSIQRWMDDAKTVPMNTVEDYTPELVERVQREHVIDWLIGNHDGHPDQLISRGGKIFAIDKGQAGKFLGKESLSVDFHPNKVFGAREPVYNTMYRWAKEGKLKVDANKVLTMIERVEQMPDSMFVAAIESYAKARAEALGQEYNWIIGEFLKKKQNIRNDFTEFFKSIYGKKFAFEVRATKTIQKVGDLTFEEIAKTRIVGKVVKVDAKDIEDLNVLMWTEKEGNKDILKAQFKLTEDSWTKVESMLKTQAGKATAYVESASERQATTWYNQILGAVKTINGHKDNLLFNPGKIRAGKEALAEVEKFLNDVKRGVLKATDEGLVDAAKYYKGYKELVDNAFDGLTKMNSTVEETIFAGKELAEKAVRQSKNKGEIKKFVFPEKVSITAPDNLPYQISFVDNLHVEKSVEKGFVKVIDTVQPPTYAAGKVMKVTFPDGSVFELKGSDFKLVFRGEATITTPVKDPKALLEKLEQLGINNTTPSEEYKEILYLWQNAYKNRLDELPEVLDIMRITDEQQQLTAFREFWSKHLGKDITRMPSYNPEGETGFFGDGWSALHHLDPISKGMPGFHLFHSYQYGGSLSSVQFLEEALNNGGRILSRMERFRKGQSSDFLRHGASATADAEVGGADYLFTNLQRDFRQEGLHLKVKTMDRLDANWYTNDSYGQVTSREHGWVFGKKEIVKAKGSYGDPGINQVTLKHGVDLWSEVENWTVDSYEQKNELISLMRSHGFDKMPDGRTLVSFFKVRDAEAL